MTKDWDVTDEGPMGDLLGIGLVAEYVDLRGRVVEVAPRIEMDDVFLGRIWRRVVAHRCVLLAVGWFGGLVGHAASPQHRSA